MTTYVPDSTQALLAFGFAACVALIFVPISESLARRIGAIDHPKERSLHEVPTPKLGGIAVLIAVLAGGAIFLPWDEETRAILAGAALIALVGVVDDIFELGAGPKLLGQTVAATIPVAAGVTVNNFTVPFLGRLEPGSFELLDLPSGGAVDIGNVLTVLGIVAIVNVINFSDGVDGLASGVCVISAATLAIVALSLERNAAGVLAAITAGSALGFLRHGFPPASSFMGDTGSNLLGYLLATVAIQGSLKTNAVLALALPLVVLAVPILDTGFVIAKRLKYRQPIHRGDRWHFHHRMANIGFSQRRTLLYLYGWTLIAASVALALRFIPYSDDRGNFDPEWTAVMIAFLAVALAASIYVIVVLEILKLRRLRFRELVLRRAPRAPAPVPAEVDEGVVHELETGEIPRIDPRTGHVAVTDPESGRPETVPSAEGAPVRRPSDSG